MRWRPSSLVFAASVVAFACGDSGVGAISTAEDAGTPGLGRATPSLGDAAVVPDAAGDAATDARTDADPAPPWGLATRPANATCLAPARPTGAPSITLAEAFPSLPLLSHPTDMIPSPVGPQFYVLEQAGLVRTIASAAATSIGTALDLTAKVINGGEAGLLGIALHPKFPATPYMYLFYVIPYPTPPVPDGPIQQSILVRYATTDGGLSFDPASEAVLLRIDQTEGDHFGGRLAFGPDGYLYIGLGDGGLGTPAQDPNSLLGKMIRIDVDGPPPYGIPPTNPFKNGGGLPEVYALGFRNPWRWSIDLPSGDIWVGDVGQGNREEIDRVEMNGNYGWPIREGATCYQAATCNYGALIDPIVDYTHADGVAVMGGYVYRGSAIPGLAGKYLFGDWGGVIWSLDFDPVTAVPQKTVLSTINADFMRISAFARDNANELYVIDWNVGQVWKIVPTGAPAPTTFPQKLSQTGCVDPAAPTKPAAGVIPYDVVSSFFTAGASEERGFAIPDATTIQVGSDGTWQFPIGSVAMQTFSFAGERAETRLLARLADGNWTGFTYQWAADQSDARLVAGNATLAEAATSTWYVPTQWECLGCHTAAAGRTLGLGTSQLDTDFTYPNGARQNQLAALDHVGLFDTHPNPALTPALSSLTSSAPLAARARSYLHGNCSMCHQPGAVSGMDLRISSANLGACNVAPASGDLGVAGAQLLTPGDPTHSLISLRAHTTDAHRMAPFTTRAVDIAGAQVLDRWITGLTACP